MIRMHINKNLLYGLIISISILGIVIWMLTKFYTNNITIEYKNIKCYIDGTLQILRDKDNEIIEPFIFKEKVYIPVEPVAKIIGYKTEWDEKEALNIYKMDYYNEKHEATTFVPLIQAGKINKKKLSRPILINNKPLNTKELSESILIEDVTYIPTQTAEFVFNKEVIYSQDTLSVYFQDNNSANNQRLDTHQSITYERLEKLLNQWINEYDFIQVDSIGKSTEGREIYSVVINGDKDFTEKKDKLLLIGGIHSREDYSVTLLAKTLDEILLHFKHSGQWDGYDLNALFSEVELHVVLLANPDGSNIAHHGIESSSNYKYLKKLPDLSGDNRWWKANARGVDLNRNFPDTSWPLKETTVPASEGYKGDYPGSEKESQAIIKYCEDNHFIMSISFHTSGNSIFWADQRTHDIFQGVDEDLIDEFCELTGYRKLKVSQDASVYGSGFENWFRETYQRICFCVELAPYPGLEYVQHPDECFDSLVWSKAKHSGVFFISKIKELKNRMYDVYIEGQLDKTFYSKKEAIQYAIKNRGKIIYNNAAIN